jgi:tRNA nucleotidyltransferase (CCA-adding enzyme)
MTGTIVFPAELPVPNEVVRIATRLEEAGHEAWCVGGSVRDALLGAGGGDFDIATSARPEEVQQLFRRTVAVGVRFGTVGVLDRDQRLHEVTTFRHDVQTDGRHAVVQYGASLEDDLARRDLTINAIAYHPLRHDWRDPFGGAADLAAGLVRAVGRPTDRFREDYLRILRALRFAARLDFRIDDDTWTAAREQSPGLAQLSAERVRDEWFKSLRTARSVERLVDLWWASGAAAVRLPELATPGTVAAMPGVAASRPGERDPVLFTAVLVRDAPAVLDRLRASNAEVERARLLERAPGAPAGDSPADVRRWLARAGTAADDVIAAATLVHGRPPVWASDVAAVRERADPLTRRDLAISGDDLRAAGVPAGPRIGEVLDRLLEAVLEDPALNQREVLLARASALP